MPGLDPGIHVRPTARTTTWMAGSSPAMTANKRIRVEILKFCAPRAGKDRFPLMHDLLISGAHLVDGLGGTPYRADLAVAGGPLSAIRARRRGGRPPVDG